MSSKTCPHCGEVIPLEATRCKTCMMDLSPAKKSPSRLLYVLGFVVLMLVSGVAVFFLAKRQAVSQNVVVDKETSSIVITKKSGDGINTTRIKFDEIEKVELVVGGMSATWQVFLIKPNGDRLLIHSTSDEDLSEYAQHVSAVMNKPLVEVRKVSGMRDGLPELQGDAKDQGADKKRTTKP